MASSRIREHAATGTAVEGIAPERLHRERPGGERDDSRGPLARRDPGALVAVRRAGGVPPTGARELIGDRLAHFMSADDGDAGVRAESVEVGATTRACVSDVRQIGVGDVAGHGTGGAVIGAILSPKSARIVSSGGGDHVLDAGVAGSGGVAEVLCGVDGFRRKLRLLRLRRRSAGVVCPDSGKNAGLVAGMRSGSATGEGAGGHALAILGDTVEPGAAADAVVEVLQNGCFAAGVIVVPLRAPEDQVDLGSRFDANATGPSVIEKIVPGRACLNRARPRIRIRLAKLLHLFRGAVDPYRRLALFNDPQPTNRTSINLQLFRLLSV